MAFGLGQGETTNQSNSYNGLYSNAGFASNNGMGDITASTDFMKDILSGDPTKVAQVLAPQIDAITGRTQQRKQQIAQFGTRSGGNTAAAAGLDADTNKQITDLTGNLIGKSAEDLGSIGTNLLSQGSSDFNASFQNATTLQKQNAAKWNDIIGSIAGVAGGVLGGIPGAAGGWADIGSNIAGAVT